MKKYKYWDVLDELPDGWVLDLKTGSPLHMHSFCTNGKNILNGRKTALIRTICKLDSKPDNKSPEKNIEEKSEIKKLVNSIKID